MALAASTFRKLILEPNIAEYMSDFQSFHRAFNTIAAVDAYAAHIFTEALELRIDMPSKLSLHPYETRDDSAFRQALADKFTDFRVLRDLAKANKHAKLSRHSPLVSGSDQVTTKAKGWDEGTWDEGRWGGVPQVFVETDAGDEFYVETLVKRSVDLLDGIARELGLFGDPEVPTSSPSSQV